MKFPAQFNDFFNQISSIDLNISLAICILLCGIFSFPAFKRKWLTLNALVATTLIALALTYRCGLGILIFPFLFALIGSLISSKEKDKIEKFGRTAIQVLANAGFSIFIVLFIQDQIKASCLIICIFAIALSDTMSSEIGRKIAAPTYDISNFKKVEAGISGGISVIGTMAGLAGSFIMAFTALLYTNDFSFILYVGLIGFIGMLVDSFVGSLAQGKYLIGSKVSDYGTREQLKKGFHFFDNDLTNFVSILLTISVVMLIIK